MKFDGLIAKGIMKGVTISPGSSATMILDFKNMEMLAVAYAAPKGYKHWPGVIEIMEPVDNIMWKSKRPNKSLCTVKRTTKLLHEDKTEILKQVRMGCD